MFAVNPGVLAAGAGGSPVGQQLFLTSGSFVVPAGVTSLCIVAIGRGQDAWASFDGGGGYDDGKAGNGGELRFINDLPVTEGETLEVRFDNFAVGLLRSGAYILQAVNGNWQSNDIGGVGFAGGRGQFVSNPNHARPGGGAGGYTSNGADAGNQNIGNGGGGSSALGGGAGAAAGASPTINGLAYGGGGGFGSAWSLGKGGPGCLRIMWGAGRAFPNTNTGDL